jgi:peptide/nickel transport system permease protein
MVEQVAMEKARGSSKRLKGNFLAPEGARSQPAMTWQRDAWRRFLQQKLPVAAGIVLLGLALISILAPAIAPYDPLQQFRREGLSELGQPLSPNSKFWLGSDGLGRDLLSRILWGSRVSLGIGLTASTIAVVIALLVGGVAGFTGGNADFWIMRFVDLVMSMPTFFVMLLLVVMLKPGAWVVITVISLFSWTYPARIFRSQILAIKQRDFVLAARSLGVSSSQIFLRHLLPHVLPLVIVYLALGIPATIFSEASLSFLGLGVPPPTPSWGLMIQEGMDYYRAAPWVAFFPGLAIMLTVISFNLLGAGLREAMDPTRRGR